MIRRTTSDTGSPCSSASSDSLRRRSLSRRTSRRSVTIVQTPPDTQKRTPSMRRGATFPLTRPSYGVNLSCLGRQPSQDGLIMVRLFLLTLAVAILALLPAAAGGNASPTFTHGVASGDVRPHSAVLWTRVDQ